MIYIDVKYLKMVMYRLERAKVLRDDGNQFHLNCRCNICGDSAKNKSKKRGNFYSSKGELFYKCFNCDASMHFSQWLKDFDINVYNAYMVEKYAEKHHINQVVTEAKTRKTHKIIVPDVFVSLPKISEHLNALKTAQTRHIPLNIQEDMYYCESFFLWTKEHTDKFAEMPIKDHPRWIIPWYNRAGEVIGYQARAYGNEQPKYYTIILDKSSPKIYGLERIDFGKRVYCVEGPIDSLMLDNAVAVGSSALHTFSSDETEVTYVLDNENRNAAILKEYAKLIKLGHDVCIMPNEWKYKDLNDAVCAGFPREDLTKFIDRNTYNGLAAQMKLTSWRKTNYD